MKMWLKILIGVIVLITIGLFVIRQVFDVSDGAIGSINALASLIIN